MPDSTSKGMREPHGDRVSSLVSVGKMFRVTRDCRMRRRQALARQWEPCLWGASRKTTMESKSGEMESQRVQKFRQQVHSQTSLSASRDITSFHSLAPCLWVKKGTKLLETEWGTHFELGVSVNAIVSMGKRRWNGKVERSGNL